MARKAKPPTDRTAEQVDYAAWKAEAVAYLANRHEVRAGIIPERLWRQLYIQGRPPQEAADQAAVSAHKVRGRKR
jgi:hypothetical protein